MTTPADRSRSIRAAGVPRDPIIPLPGPPLPAEETPEEDEEEYGFSPPGTEPEFVPEEEPAVAPAEPALP
jgi:hypothetical protein